MKEVTKDQFYNFVGPKDLVVSVQHTHGTFYPATSYFKTRAGVAKGKVIDARENGVYWPTVSHYFIEVHP